MSWLPRVLAIWFALSLIAAALWAAYFGRADLRDDWDEA